MENIPDDRCLRFVDFQKSIFHRITVWRCAKFVFACFHPALDSPLHVPGNRLALFLCQRRHDRRDHLAGHPGRVDALFLEQNAHTKFLEFPDGCKAVLCVPGKAGDGLDQNAVNLPFPAVCHHALEVLAFVYGRACDARICVNIDHFPIRFAGNEVGVILILRAVGVELVFAGGADTGVSRDAQLSCNDLVLRRNDDHAVFLL